MEVVASRCVAFFGLLFGAQTFPVMLGQLDRLQPGWALAYGVAIFGSLLLCVVAAIVRRYVRVANAGLSAFYLAAMASWPLAIEVVEQERPWLWFLCTVATATAAIALPVWAASAYLVLAPAVYAIIRLTPAGGGAEWDLAALDAVYAILLGGAVLLIITLLRDAAASVDAAQATALARYARAVRQHATETERVQVDSIVHDSVLTTLLSAARAYSPEAMALSATMAGNAIGHLRTAAESSPDDGSIVGFEELAGRIGRAARDLSAELECRIGTIEGGAMSAPVADALYSATVQAMVNSIQHGGTASSILRWVQVTGGEGSLAIEVGDTGTGFDPAEVPTERLGLRVSIIERVASAGGTAGIVSQRDSGAVVSIRWPARRGGAGEPA